MPENFSRERLADLLLDPREALDLEIKNWLDLRTNNNDKAILAKAALALANSGGGFIILGLVEANASAEEAPGRPATLDGYSQDILNGVIHSYADPPFHCAVHFVANAQGKLFPIVVVPGGHRTPIRAKRSGPQGNIVEVHTTYVRKPGPRSEAPQTAQDWEQLLARCFSNRRDELFDQIRSLLVGALPSIEKSASSSKIEQWITDSKARWNSLAAQLPNGAPSTLPSGRYWIAYQIEGDLQTFALARFPEILQASVVRLTGWPPFWYPTRDGIAPYLMDNLVECWLGGDPRTTLQDREPAHSDFWRISPKGFAFLIRGYQEDGMQAQRSGRQSIVPGTLFDITLPIWRIGETLLQAAQLAKNMSYSSATLNISVGYEGLAGRDLTSVSGQRFVWEGRSAKQDSIVLSTNVEAFNVDANLPEIVRPLLAPLYALFDFFELPDQLVIEELSRMRSGRL